MEPRGSGNYQIDWLFTRKRLGLSISETTAHTYQQLAIQFWRGNARMGAMCVPVMASSIDGFLFVIITMIILMMLLCIFMSPLFLYNNKHYLEKRPEARSSFIRNHSSSRECLSFLGYVVNACSEWS